MNTQKPSVMTSAPLTEETATKPPPMVADGVNRPAPEEPMTMTVPSETTSPAPEQPRPCCRAMSAKCLACSAGQSVEEYCSENPSTAGCADVVPSETTSPAPEQPRACCRAMSAKCLACTANQSVEEYCSENPSTAGCPPPMSETTSPAPTTTDAASPVVGPSKKELKKLKRLKNRLKRAQEKLANEEDAKEGKKLRR